VSDLITRLERLLSYPRSWSELDFALREAIAVATTERQAREQAEQERDRLLARMTAALNWWRDHMNTNGYTGSAAEDMLDALDAAISPQDGQR
jgi:hypothetical protein